MLMQQLRSYLDPGYDEIEARVVRELGLPPEALAALRGIRTRGERSNADQVSPVGARSVYQFTPRTRRAFRDRYGVDAWSSPENAARAAALHLRDDFNATGNWDTAVTRYHGGPDPRNWGPRTRAYSRRVGPIRSEGRTMPMSDDYFYGMGPGSPISGPFAPGPEVVPPTGKPAAVAEAQPRRRRGGVLGLLESVFMPEPHTRWAGALRHGFWNARDSQAAYLENEKSNARRAEVEALERQSAEIDLRNRQQHGTYTVAGNNVVHTRPDGSMEIIQPPPQLGERERLLQMWQSLPPGPLRDLIERILPGFQYTEPVISSRARAQAANRAPPRPPANGGLPAGAVVLPEE